MGGGEEGGGVGERLLIYLAHSQNISALVASVLM